MAGSLSNARGTVSIPSSFPAEQEKNLAGNGYDSVTGQLANHTVIASSDWPPLE